MKSRLLVLTLAAVVSASAASFVFADTSTTGATVGTDSSVTSTQQPRSEFKRHRAKKMAAMAAVLGLTDAQQSQIKAIVSAARQANEPLRLKLATDRKHIRAMSRAIPFDEAAVRTLIAGDEAVKTDLALSRIKVWNQIQEVLTPDQQVKAKQLRQLASNKQHKWVSSE